MAKTIHVSYIDWDVDDSRDLNHLPTFVDIPYLDLELDINQEVTEDELDMIVTDYLSDEYGYCINNIAYEILR